MTSLELPTRNSQSPSTSPQGPQRALPSQTMTGGSVQPAPQQSGSGQGQQQQSLPPTGLQQQLGTINDFYSNVEGAVGGFDPRQHQFNAAQGAQLQMQGQGQGGTSLDAMARSLAQNYGLAVGRGRLVDDMGNLLVTPDQLAAASGGQTTVGEAAAKLNFVSQAIARQQNEAQQDKGRAALETGLGQVQSRGRGSLAAMQSGLYQGLADMYSNQEYEAADFSYFIQAEQLEIQQDLLRRQEKLAKKNARTGFVTGAVTALGGLFTGNYGVALQGANQAAGSAGGTGWF